MSDQPCDADSLQDVVRRLKLGAKMAAGYYHPTRRDGHGIMFSAWNGLRLAKRSLAEKSPNDPSSATNPAGGGANAG